MCTPEVNSWPASQSVRVGLRARYEGETRYITVTKFYVMALQEYTKQKIELSNNTLNSLNKYHAKTKKEGLNSQTETKRKS